MFYKDKTGEHKLQPGDRFIFQKSTGAISAVTKSGERLCWKEGRSDKTDSGLKEIFENHKIPPQSQSLVFCNLVEIIALSHGLTTVKDLSDLNSANFLVEVR